jgi:hypothetical protein
VLNTHSVARRRQSIIVFCFNAGDEDITRHHSLTVTKFIHRDRNPIKDGRQKCFVRPENARYLSVHGLNIGEMHTPDALTEIRLAHFKLPEQRPQVLPISDCSEFPGFQLVLYPSYTFD